MKSCSLRKMSFNSNQRFRVQVNFHYVLGQQKSTLLKIILYLEFFQPVRKRHLEIKDLEEKLRVEETLNLKS